MEKDRFGIKDTGCMTESNMPYVPSYSMEYTRAGIHQRAE